MGIKYTNRYSRN